MRREQRSFTFETVEVPVSAIANSDLAAEYLPNPELIADSELKKMGAAGKTELARRKKQRAAHVKAGRAFYVRLSKGYSSSIVIVTRSKDKDRDSDGRLLGNSAESRSDAIWSATHMLENHDEGGVIYVDKLWWGESEVIDVRPNLCEALAKTGKHDWFYVPTGDDICRSCGLLS